MTTTALTRIPKTYQFEIGEKVLCYEPDPSKVKVLYDSKILGVYDTKDRRGRKIIQYKVHFQGWSSSWDRKVNAEYVLKDSVENRQLQRDLAEKAQLQLGAYLYRKERRGNKKRPRKLTGHSEDSCDANCSSMKQMTRDSSEDNFSLNGALEKHDDNVVLSNMDYETDSYISDSSTESLPEEDRVRLRISERLRNYLEYDYEMIVKSGKLYSLPAHVTVVTILENFVKHYALKMIFSTTQVDTRRRGSQQRTEKKEKDYEKLIATVDLLKEVVDGIRAYLDFTLTDYLLYSEEKEYVLSYLSGDNLKNFTYVPSPSINFDWSFISKIDGRIDEAANINFLSNVPSSVTDATDIFLMKSLTSSVVNNNTTNSLNFDNTMGTFGLEDYQAPRRKLRSHRSDDIDITWENCLSNMTSNNSGVFTPLFQSAANLNYLKSVSTISSQIRDFVQSVLSWHLISSDTAPVPSMIFGAPYLGRLLVKLPEFLNSSVIADDKLKIILQYLSQFVNYLEARKELFAEENYTNGVFLKNPTTSSIDILKSIETGTTNSQIQIDQGEKQTIANMPDNSSIELINITNNDIDSNE